MSNKPIELSTDSDLRLSQVALERAAHRAREIAEKTGTAIVITRNGVLEYLKPQSAPTVAKVPSA